MVNLVPYKDEAEARLDTERGRLLGSIVIPPNLSVSYLKKILGSWRQGQYVAENAFVQKRVEKSFKIQYEKIFLLLYKFTFIKSISAKYSMY